MAATKDIDAKVILVNKQDVSLGSAAKLTAHEQGLLHRAFSIFIFREGEQLELLLQQRAAIKYHSPGLWTNTCCSHPSPGESLHTAAKRRLKEEFNLIMELHHVGQFHYLAHFDNGLIEHELDHVFVGRYDNEKIIPNEAEIQAYRWVDLPSLKQALVEQPQKFTPWLAKALSVAEAGL